MYRRIASGWPFRQSTGRLTQEPSAVVFQKLRIRLTLWYCAVLGVALILFGVVLYGEAHHLLIDSVESDTTSHAYAHASQWLRDNSALSACPFSTSPHSGEPPSTGYMVPEMVICFTPDGSLPVDEDTTNLPATFLSNTLAKTALQTGQSASDIVNGGSNIGDIYRYAVVVQDPLGRGVDGVVVTGEPIQVQENALSVLLTLLLSIGGIALMGAGLGGLFLANRALAPARLAWEHQQRFLADASHELRTPLTLMRADAEVLLRSRRHLETDDVALLEDIVAETNHMGNLANNMLTLARLDNRSTHQEHEVVNLSEIVRAGARRIQALADQKEITIQQEIDQAAVVIGDPMLLEQAVLALLDNAIKYNHQGGSITLRTAVKDHKALLEISDTGIGIAREHLAHLGERFYRVDKARSREAGGTGLGLSIVRGIAASHGGNLNLNSVPEQGTTVTLVLPLV